MVSYMVNMVVKSFLHFIPGTGVEVCMAKKYGFKNPSTVKKYETSFVCGECKRKMHIKHMYYLDVCVACYTNMVKIVANGKSLCAK